MSNSEDRICKSDGKWSDTDSERIEYLKINGSRIELRCGKCNGLVNWWVEHLNKRNIIPVKGGWSDKECEAMR
jgi:hypothetical protein